MESTSEKKWYIINQSAGRENNLFYLINATEKEVTTLQCLIDNDADESPYCLYSDYHWGIIQVVSDGFDTRKEAIEYFQTAKEFENYNGW